MLVKIHVYTIIRQGLLIHNDLIWSEFADFVRGVHPGSLKFVGVLPGVSGWRGGILRLTRSYQFDNEMKGNCLCCSLFKAQLRNLQTHKTTGFQSYWFFSLSMAKIQKEMTKIPENKCCCPEWGSKLFFSKKRISFWNSALNDTPGTCFQEFSHFLWFLTIDILKNQLLWNPADLWVWKL